VDTKKKELVGDFKNNGRELRPKGNPEPVRVHDFRIPEPGKVAPYGVYDIAANHGWVSVGISADTGAFAVETIRRWWHRLGKPRYPNASHLTVTADCRPAPAVESTTGAVAAGHEGSCCPTAFALCRCLISSDRSSVSSRRSSNRTCRFPASGFRLRHQAFALGKSVRRSGKAKRPSVSWRYSSGCRRYPVPACPLRRTNQRCRRR
jgi:hypothetical protein